MLSKEKVNFNVSVKNIECVLLLVLPTFLSIILFVASFHSFGLSILLFIFVLPLFYVVDQRLKYQINEIKQEKLSYKDGYRAFFIENKSSHFGFILSIVYFLLSLIICFLLSLTFVDSLVNCFPDSIYTYQQLKEIVIGNTFLNADSHKFLLEQGSPLIQPLTVLTGLIFFVPILVIFIRIQENLSNNYMSSVILPDIEENISISQARNITKRNVGKGFVRKRFKLQLKANWIYLLIYSLIYAGSLISCSFLKINEFVLAPFVILITPSVGIIVMIYFSYFMMKNNYQIIENNKVDLIKSLSKKTKSFLYQIYVGKEYIHKEESKMREEFIYNSYHDEDDTGDVNFSKNGEIE